MAATGKSLVSQLVYAFFFFFLITLSFVSSSIPPPRMSVMVGALVATSDHKVSLRMRVRREEDLGEKENEPGSPVPLIIWDLRCLSLENSFYRGEKQMSMLMTLFEEVSVTYSKFNTKFNTKYQPVSQIPISVIHFELPRR